MRWFASLFALVLMFGFVFADPYWDPEQAQEDAKCIVAGCPALADNGDIIGIAMAFFCPDNIIATGMTEADFESYTDCEYMGVGKGDCCNFDAGKKCVTDLATYGTGNYLKCKNDGTGPGCTQITDCARKGCRELLMDDPNGGMPSFKNICSLQFSPDPWTEMCTTNEDCGYSEPLPSDTPKIVKPAPVEPTLWDSYGLWALVGVILVAFVYWWLTSMKGKARKH